MKSSDVLFSGHLRSAAEPVDRPFHSRPEAPIVGRGHEQATARTEYTRRFADRQVRCLQMLDDFRQQDAIKTTVDHRQPVTQRLRTCKSTGRIWATSWFL